MPDQDSKGARLQDLLAYPREELDVELKGWLDPGDPAHKADLAKALLALTNHGGGHLVIGFQETGGQWAQDAARPATLDAFNQDLVNGIVASYAEPAFHCELHLVAHPQSGQLFPIVVVPSIQATPVRAKRDGPQDENGKPRHVNINCYYIRRPGPKSEPPQSGQEWDQLIRRCIRASKDELVSTIAGFFSGAPAVVQAQTLSPTPKATLDAWTKEAESRRLALLTTAADWDIYKLGVWSCSYALRGVLKTPSLQEFFQILQRVQGHETGWPTWWMASREELAPYSADGFVECWLKGTGFGDAAHSDFWLGSPAGRMYLVRGYQEDSADNLKPGKFFDLTIPVWRVGECLLHAERLAAEMGDDDTVIDVEFAWHGLKGRTLVAWANSMRMLHPGRTSRQGSVVSSYSVKASSIRGTLSAIAAEITKPLYAAFDFFELPASLAQEEIAHLLGRR